MNVTILDRNDNEPVFSGGDCGDNATSVSEDAAVGTDVCRIVVTDADVNPANNMLRSVTQRCQVLVIITKNGNFLDKQCQIFMTLFKKFQNF